MGEPLAPLLDVIPDGVIGASLPTSLPVGDVNCWILPEAPITLVDPGVARRDSIRRLEDQLLAIGLRFADVEQIVVTHAHPDHCGGAAVVAEASGAPIICSADEGRKLADRTIVFPMDDLFASLGVADEGRAAWHGAISIIDDVTRWPDEHMLAPVGDGDRLHAGGRTFEVVLSPGHTAGHLSLWDGEEILLSGDHLLARVSPNPVFESDPHGPGGRRPTMGEYLATLDRFVAMAPAAVLPGHHEAFTDVPTLVARLRDDHARRADAILAIAARRGPCTGWEVAAELFPGMAGPGLILALSEVAGHLDLLVADGRLSRDDGVPQRFAGA